MDWVGYLVTKVETSSCYGKLSINDDLAQKFYSFNSAGILLACNFGPHIGVGKRAHNPSRFFFFLNDFFK